jgi:hypothetical protein
MDVKSAVFFSLMEQRQQRDMNTSAGSAWRLLSSLVALGFGLWVIIVGLGFEERVLNFVKVRQLINGSFQPIGCSKTGRSDLPNSCPILLD